MKFDVKTLLLGGFNVHHPFWNCTRANDYGIAIHNNLRYSIFFSISPIHHTNTSSSSFYFDIFNDFNFNKSMHSLLELRSGHNPLLLKLQVRMPSNPYLPLKLLHKLIGFNSMNSLISPQH